MRHMRSSHGMSDMHVVQSRKFRTEVCLNGYEAARLYVH
jgi:hypothetical protein